jgi:hypothetical protein
MNISKLMIVQILLISFLHAEVVVEPIQQPPVLQPSMMDKVKNTVAKGADETKHFFTETTPAAFKYAGEKMKVGYQKTGEFFSHDVKDALQTTGTKISSGTRTAYENTKDFFSNRVWPTLQSWGHAIADSKANPRNW